MAAITPIFLQPFFLFFSACAGLVLLSLTILHLRRRHRLAHPEIEAARQRDKEVEKALQALDTACKAGDSHGFLACCRTTIQHQLATSWNMSAEAVTRADLQERIGSEHPLTTLFAHAEEAAYSGARLDQKSMENFLTILKTELTRLP